MKKKISFRGIFTIVVSFMLVSLFYHADCQQLKDTKDICTGCKFTIDRTIYQDLTSCKCYINIKYVWDWSNAGANTSIYPYGVDVAAMNPNDPGHPNVITDIQEVSGFSSWPGTHIKFISNSLTSSSGNCLPITGITFYPLKTYGWKSTASPPQAIPKNLQLEFRVYIDFSNTNKIFLWVRNPNYSIYTASGAPDCWWTCWDTATFSKPPCPVLIADCPQVCTGAPYTTIHVYPPVDPATPPAPTNCPNRIEWYAYSVTGSSNTYPSLSPFSSNWVFKQKGNNDLQTTNLQYPTWYVALITIGCYSYTTTPIEVKLCPEANGFGAVTPSLTGLIYFADSNKYHACTSWSGTRTISFPDPGICNYGVKWSMSSDGGSNWSTPPVQTNPPNVWDISNKTMNAAGTCFTDYRFKADVTWACCSNGATVLTQTATLYSAPIIIDQPTPVGKIIGDHFWNCCGNPCPSNQNPYDNEHPIICYDRSIILKWSGQCSKIIKWDSLHQGNWITVAGAQHYNEWNTNNLTTPTQFRVEVQNGVCPSKFASIKVRVKPKLLVDIHGCEVLCPPHGCQILSHTSYMPPGYQLTFQWYKDGDLLTGQVQKFLNVSDTGNYYVEVKDPVCPSDTSSLSNIINICQPGIYFEGRPCFCDGKTFTISAQPNDCYLKHCNSFKYSWSGPGGFSAITQSITNNVDGTYTVTVDCGTPLCQTTSTINITKCP